MRFKLVRYFTLASLGMFVLMALALAWIEHQQGEFFKSAQSEQGVFFQNVQENFTKQQEVAARRDLLIIHESGNINLTRLFANALWQRDFAPFVAKAQAIDAGRCRALPDVVGSDGKTIQSDEKKSCFAEVGLKLREIKEFKALDAKVFDSMKKSTVFKIKVYDTTGTTVYSSDHKQMGEDKSTNAGWKRALGGKPASQLSHRDSFGAFEGVVSNRDLLESYIPVLAPGTDQIVGVFEVYSDVTPFLAQIKQSADQTRKTASDNQAKVESVASRNQEVAETASNQGLAIVLVMLVILFASLYAIVRRADNIIAQQDKEREHSQQQLAQAEKMASLGQMVAGVAHQLNTPIAFTHSNISMALDALKSLELPLKVARLFAKLVKNAEGDKLTLNVDHARQQIASITEEDTDVTMLSEMLGDTLNGIEQMRELVENLRDFTRLDRAKVTSFDLNKGLRNVAYIAKSVIPNRVQVVENYSPLPAIDCNPSQLNQVFLNLINNAAQSIPEEGTVTVRSGVENQRIRIDITDTGSGIPANVLPHIFDNFYTTKPAGEGTGLGLPIAKTIVTEHGGEIKVESHVGKGTTFSVYLPILVMAA